MSYDIIKGKVNDLMNNRSYPGKRYFDLFMIILVIVSVVLLIVELEFKDANIGERFFLLETIILGVFIVEYLIRFWVCSSVRYDFKRAFLSSSKNWCIKFIYALYLITKNKLKFMVQPMSIIDLLAILPMFRVFRAFRIFRILRLFKLIRYSPNIESLFMIFQENAYEMGVVLGFISIFIVIASTLIFTLEGGGTGYFQSIGDAFWWSIVTITTVGYGDKFPVTDLGRIVAGLLMLSAIIAIALPSGIVASALTQKIIFMREGRISMKQFKEHILVLGWNNSAEQLEKEFQKIEDEEKRDIVAVTLKPVEQIDSKQVVIKHGDFTKEGTLNDVNA